MSRRPALIFDFGNVIAYFDYAIAWERLGRPLELSGEEFHRRASAGGLTGLSRLYESGAISSEEFHRRFVAGSGFDCAFDVFRDGWADIFRGNEPVHRLIARLKESGYTIVVGSNTNEIQARHFVSQFPEVFRNVDALVASYQVGCMKPAPAFYEACARAAGEPPDRCVFIDDLAENVEGARRAGLLGILYRDDGSLVESLRGVGVDIGAGHAG